MASRLSRTYIAEASEFRRRGGPLVLQSFGDVLNAARFDLVGGTTPRLFSVVRVYVPDAEALCRLWTAAAGAWACCRTYAMLARTFFAPRRRAGASCPPCNSSSAPEALSHLSEGTDCP